MQFSLENANALKHAAFYKCNEKTDPKMAQFSGEWFFSFPCPLTTLHHNKTLFSWNRLTFALLLSTLLNPIITKKVQFCHLLLFSANLDLLLFKHLENCLLCCSAGNEDILCQQRRAGKLHTSFQSHMNEKNHQRVPMTSFYDQEAIKSSRKTTLSLP